MCGPLETSVGISTEAAKKKRIKKLRQEGIEPPARPIFIARLDTLRWQGRILPLNHWRLVVHGQTI